jgi:alkylhydroperoxidase/carboxymuconolactone decarboxylase family protein YurZ
MLKEFAGYYYDDEKGLDEKTRQLVALAAFTVAGCET